MNTDQSRGLIVGVGTEYGDDAFGLLVARHLARRTYENITIITHPGEGASLMETWQGYERVVIVDCAASGASIASRYTFNASIERIPTKMLRYSTHAFGVAEAIETARALGRLPERLVVIAVEGQSFNAGESVDERLASLVAPIAAEALAAVSGH
ncbi:hypothetical protein C3F09_04315 [candidate division GN15 bacterium]|uniref:Hydrogenase maturation protease n=1 Tax=candidate division GN15 bacterium TaxID=2072418 RepID=A0A855X384_9BACT|nr:MAG: hypothetical protein C3F09_04315 [candidate division GN15 bacterium]